MQDEGINEECDERPGLFEIPTPIAASRDVGPDSPDENPFGETEDGIAAVCAVPAVCRQPVPGAVRRVARLSVRPRPDPGHRLCVMRL